MPSKNFDHLLYRKQFCYGPEKVTLTDWKTAPMPDENWISYHPALTVTQVQENGIHATLLGFILNPEAPQEDDQTILMNLCKRSNSIDQFIEATETCGGRWAIILHREEQSVVFNDAGGTRTVYTYQDAAGKVWLASQPGLLAERFGLQESVASKEFRASPEFQKRTEIWWPGDVTPFSEVKAMLPNHLVDLKTGKTRRYWPNRPLVICSLEEGTHKAAKILKGIMEAAHARFPLAMSLSSGLDSRTVFSACRDFADDVFVFSMKYRHLTDDSDDIRIPRQITEKLNLPHHVFDTTLYHDPDFKQTFDRNVVGLKTDWANIAECRYANLPLDTVVLKGSISEIMRCRYWSLGIYPRKVDLAYIVNLMGYVGGSTPLVSDALAQWYADALPTGEYGYKLLDLLSWEIEVGRWYALGQTLYDIAGEDFTAFNCRSFFNTMLGIDPKYRSYPNHIAQREIVRILWPELAEFPYTPSRVLPKKTFRDTQLFSLLRSAKKAILK